MTQLRTVSMPIHKGSAKGVDVLTCDCGSNVFMVFFEDRHLHIHCESCSASYRIQMNRWNEPYKMVMKDG